MPIYLVKTPNGELMVSAPTKAGAVNHVIKKTVTAEPLTAEAVVGRMEDGEKVIKVNDAPEAPAASAPKVAPKAEVKKAA